MLAWTLDHSPPQKNPKTSSEFFEVLLQGKHIFRQPGMMDCTNYDYHENNKVKNYISPPPSSPMNISSLP